MRALAWLKDIFESIRDFEHGPSRILAFAGIHATVLTILIGIMSGYCIFARDKIHEMEMQTLMEAERINQMHFARSYYLPSKNDFAKYNDPRNIDQKLEMFVYITILLSPNQAVPGMEVPTLPADRAERALQLLNMLVHQYPFPEAISSIGGSISMFTPRQLLFKDRTEVTRWADDMEKLLRSMHLFIYMGKSYVGQQMMEYLQALHTRDRMLRKRWSTDFFLQVLGQADSLYLFEDCIRNLQKAEEINRSVKFSLAKLEMQERRLIPTNQLLLFSLFTMIAFFSGVIMPMCARRVRRIFLFWIPCTFYFFAFPFMIYQFFF